MVNLLISYGYHKDEFLAISVGRYLRRNFEMNGVGFLDLTDIKNPLLFLHNVDRILSPEIILDLHDTFGYDQKLFFELSVPENILKALVGKFSDGLVEIMPYSSQNHLYPKSYGSLEIFCGNSRGDQELCYVKLEEIVKKLYGVLTQ